jgi:hypothetical protein
MFPSKNTTIPLSSSALWLQPQLGSSGGGPRAKPLSLNHSKASSDISRHYDRNVSKVQVRTDIAQRVNGN